MSKETANQVAAWDQTTRHHMNAAEALQKLMNDYDFDTATLISLTAAAEAHERKAEEAAEKARIERASRKPLNLRGVYIA